LVLGLQLKVPGDQGVIREIGTLVIYSTLLLFAVVFVLIDSLYKIIRSKSNPNSLASYLGKEISRQLAEIGKEAEFIAKYIKVRNETLSQGYALAASYNSGLFQERFKRIDDQIDELTELIHKLAKKEEIKSANYSLWVMSDVASQYFQLRKDSSVAYLHEEALFALTSDSDSRISRILESIRILSEEFIRDERYHNALELVEIYKRLALASSEIKFVNIQYGFQENPIFEKIVGYFGVFISLAIEKNQEDIVLRSSAALSTLSAVAAKKGWRIQIEAIRGHHTKIIQYSLIRDRMAIFPTLIDNELRIIDQVFANMVPSPMQILKPVLEDFARFTGAQAIVGDSFIALNSPINKLERTIGGLIEVVTHPNSGRELKDYFTIGIVDLLDELCLPLRDALEKIECSPGLFNRAIQFIGTINATIISLLAMPPLFVGKCIESDDRSYVPQEAADMLTITAVDALEAGHPDFVKDCIQAIDNIASKYFSSRKFTYDPEIRIMTNIAKIGVLALKLSALSVFEETKIKITEFDKKGQAMNTQYLAEQKAKGAVVPPSLPLVEGAVKVWQSSFLRARQNYSGVSRDDDPESRIANLVEQVDVDNYVDNVWPLPSEN
jgi:primosomal protein N''